MEQSNSKIGEVMKMKLDHNIPSIHFDQVWNKHQRSNRKILGLRKVFAIPAIALMSLFVLVMAGFKLTAIEDKTDYPFVNDQQVIGKWQSVDRVAEIDQFIPGQKIQQGDLFLKELVFIKDGEMLTAIDNGNGSLGPTPSTWTAGLVLNKYEKTAEKYEIKDINGSIYMFIEAKTGDYVYFHRKPYYYVFTKVDDADYSTYQLTRIEDKVDYPFVDDPQLIGTWEAVDAVETIDEFETGIIDWPKRLLLRQFNIAANGKLSGSTSDGPIPEENLAWTKGLILDKHNKTASKYEIKELKGDTYLFYEWKSGDYTIRGMQPKYYVLKKVQ
ncbi:MAG: hypothetical protein VB084_16340 [Syntrophomonadaceae bacterium]|nr:hypothetical protein [Syntrophomonadaceae bacterium]